MRNTLRVSGEGNERGATLVFLGVSLIALLGVMTLAVDLGMLYVGRNQAQRAADAAALAGADSFATSGCLAVENCTPGLTDETLARQQAELVGAKNQILEQAPQILDSDITFNYPYPYEPQITVTVRRTAGSGNPVPTIFAKIFGIYTANVSATATAEAYNGPSAQSCVLPFLVPNCDPNTPPPGTSPYPPKNFACESYNSQGNVPYAGWQYIAPGTAGPPPTPATVYTSSIGQIWQLHYSGTVGTPSQFYLVDFGNSNSGSAIGDEILHCAPQPINCWDTLNSATGKKVGPVTANVEQRINASGDGLGQGQDSIVSPVLGGTAGPSKTSVAANLGDPAYSLSILAGSGNPNYSQLGATPFPGPSSSLGTVPVYQNIVDPATGNQTTALNPGSGNTVQVIGFMQLFLVDAYHSGSIDTVDAVVTNISGCDNTPASISSTGGVPIRLIRTQ